ncbi:complement factor D-like isoform X3 [Trematomus bernacchii]|uniref:complement factor D-like isoform X3 n=1 Tax=Trematomus bernacchii TaxID=40690 RepID=UPI0014699FCC|nr:complement factor D-like isoform X3 [Trematomus bernacchii]
MAGMMTSLLLLLLAGVTVGRVVDLQKRIYGGKECAATERLHHVRLRKSDGKKNGLCGGTLISKDWILTAGHCVPEVGTKSVKAFLGVNRDGEENPVDINIDHIRRYKEGDGTPHDIALLKLPASSGLKPASLPDCSKPPPQIGQTVQIAGHITTSIDKNDKKVSHKTARLLCAEINVVQCKPQTCQYGYYTPYLFCYQGTGVDAGKGDSGGGVVFNDRIYGVHVSSVITACVEARATDVCKYISWITTETKIPIPSK